MYRNLLLGLFAFAMVAGCQNKQPADPYSKPAVAPQMKQLDKFVGQWEGTAKLVSPTVEELAEYDPAIAEELGGEFHGESTSEFSLDGTVLKSQSWHEMGDGQKMHYTEIWTWDAKHNKYRTYGFSDWGEHGTGWMWSDDGGATYEMKGSMTDAHGNTKNYSGHVKFVNDDTMEWEWSEHMGLFQKMTFAGTSERMN